MDTMKNNKVQLDFETLFFLLQNDESDAFLDAFLEKCGNVRLLRLAKCAYLVLFRVAKTIEDSFSFLFVHNMPCFFTDTDFFDGTEGMEFVDTLPREYLASVSHDCIAILDKVFALLEQTGTGETRLRKIFLEERLKAEENEKTNV